MTAKPKLEGAALAPLVYWLLVIAGLAGITVLRFGSYGKMVTSDDIFALWAGTVLGVGLGQIASAARIRLWVPLVIALFGFWFLLPILFLVVDGIFGATAQTFILAFLPATICGYLSLTERGALLSFWYPAVLWMIVILDGPMPGVFDERFALPFVVGLAALFVVYLRARQTRRVAIWKAHGSTRLAETMPRTVLRVSPLRSASQHVFSALTGATALVLTAWIAPHLWETAKDPWRAPSSYGSSARGHSSAHSAYGSNGAKPCCPYGAKKRERVKEYFPLQRAHDSLDDDSYGEACRPCAYEGGTVASTFGSSKWTYGGTPGSGLASGVGTNPYGPWDYGSSYGPSSGSYGSTTTWATTTTGPTDLAPLTTPATTPTYDPPPAVTPAIAPVPPAVAPAAPPAAKTSSTSATTTPHSAAVGPNAPLAGPSAPLSAPPPLPEPRGASLSLPAPWLSSLGLCTIAFAFILFSRAVRRVLTLRHLAHPFWDEPFDQRISNHWERMLIGLRDAGVEPGGSEQPLAFAKRIGIEGMEACATILERVRHGVRVDSEDLTNMRASADAVFRAARQRAGFAGRLTAWLRPPTA